MSINIVYLDDEAELCSIFSEIFTSSDVFVNTFTHVDVALNYIKINSPDLIFIDYRLPGITGDQIAIKLKLSVPIALITGDLDVQPIYPFAKIFNKPFDINDIILFINSYKKSAAAA